MRRWKVELDRSIDPRSLLDDRYYVVRRPIRTISRDGGLHFEVACDEAAADDLRGRPGVVSVTPAQAGPAAYGSRQQETARGAGRISRCGP